MNWKDLLDRYTHSLWIQAIACILLLWGGTSLIGKAFDTIENSSRTHIAAEVSQDGQQASENDSNPLDDLFTDGSGAFGDWEEFSEMPKTSSETARPSQSSSRPQSSNPVSEPSEPSQAESSIPESSEDSLPPESSETSGSTQGGNSPEDAVSIGGDSSKPTGPDPSVSETVPDPSIPTEPSSSPASEVIPSTPDEAVSAGGESPVDAPDANVQE